MTTTNNLTTRRINTTSLIRRMVIGAAIGLILIALFISGVKNPRLEWGSYWMVKPLLIVPLAGAGGGFFTYLMEHLLGYQGGTSKIIAVLISIIGFIIALWLGSVLGLNGTLWN